MVLIGYGGHGYVAYAIATAMGLLVNDYCDTEKKIFNPYELNYLGRETDETALQKMQFEECFIAIGDGSIRSKIAEQLLKNNISPINLIHPSVIIGHNLKPHQGIMLAPAVVINPLVQIGTGVICNTAAVVEHECVLGNFSHIAPGAVLCGNVQVGDHSFIGARAVVKPGIKIGRNVIIGAGAVVVKNIPDNAVVVGNPAKNIVKK